MTPKEFAKQIMTSADAARAAGQRVEVSKLGICVYRGEDDEYFFQGDDMDRVEKDIATAVDAAGGEVSEEDALLWMAQSW